MTKGRRGGEKRKGRDWLEDSAATNTQQSQVKAALDEPIVYDTDSRRNPANFSRDSRNDIDGELAGLT